MLSYSTCILFVQIVHDTLVSYCQERMDMKREADRLLTYANWNYSAIQRPDILAKAGLYYTGIDDRVQCPFCHGVLNKWQRSDIPYSEHYTHFPYCRFICGYDFGNLLIESASPLGHMTASASVTVTSHSVDIHKEFNRLKTFSRWSSNVMQTPYVLAEAGFYHLPSKEKPDCVKCAYCRGELYNWQENDDPWIEHARWFPNCPYIQLCMGKDVVHDICEIERPVVRVENLDSPEAEGESLQSTGDTFLKQWNSPTVQANLEMGFTEANLEKIVEKCLRERPGNFPSAEELAAMAIDLEDVQVAKAAAAAAIEDSSNRERLKIGLPVKDTFAEYWKSPAVQANLDMGFHEGSVKQIVEICLRERVGKLPSAVELAAMIMDLEES